MWFLLRVLTVLSFLPFLSFPSPSPTLTPIGPVLVGSNPPHPTTPCGIKQPRTTVSPVDIPFADEMNDSFDLQDGGSGGGGTHVIIRDVKMTINDQEIVLNRSDGLVDPITAARIQTKPPYIEERHPKFRVIDSHN